MKAVIIIPARHASTRLPGKPLLAAGGKPIIQHTYERARKSKRVSDVIVATDDERIFNAVESFGGKAAMTSPDHESGTARVAEAAAGIDADVIVNLQGDEPEIDPENLDRLVDMQIETRCFASTLACRFERTANASSGSPDDPAAVKVILGKKLSGSAFQALYFTRSVCPYPRDDKGFILNPQQYFLHVGVYAFFKEGLQNFAASPPGALEKIERLEQLRILEMGKKIAVGVIEKAAPGIDTPEDFEAFKSRVLAR